MAWTRRDSSRVWEDRRTRRAIVTGRRLRDSGGYPSDGGDRDGLDGDRDKGDPKRYLDTSGDLFRRLEELSGSAPPDKPSGLTSPSGQAGGSTSSSHSVTTAYSQSGGSQTQTGQTYTASSTDQSAIIVNDSG